MAQAGQLSLSTLPIDITELVREKIAWLKPQTAPAGFIIELQPHPAVICDVDPLRLGQVLTILMDNALRYAGDGHRLDITIARQREAVVMTFRDYGIGVSEDFLPQIFERFSRADSSRARHSGGSGLGLSIALAICEAHGGSLRAENHQQNGMRFILDLPT
jgi:signal transduction histidine kinase